MLAIVIDVSWQVTTRFLMRDPSSYTEEVARFLLIWISLLGTSLVYRRRMHLGIDLLTSKLEGNLKHWSAMLSYLMSSLFAMLAMVIGGSQLTSLTFELSQVSGALGIPMGYIYIVIPISGTLIVLYSADFIIQEFKQLQ